MTPDQFVQGFFSLFILAAFTFYLVLGGALLEWRERRKDKKR